MICVVDASVAAKWFLREVLHREAFRLLADDAVRLAPDWIVQEVAQVAFKKWHDGEIGPDQAKTIVRVLPDFMAQLYPSLDLVDRALAIAMMLRHPMYDCLYLACAEIVDGTVVTANARLCRAVAETPFAHLVRSLSDFPP